MVGPLTGFAGVPQMGLTPLFPLLAQPSPTRDGGQGWGLEHQGVTSRVEALGRRRTPLSVFVSLRQSNCELLKYPPVYFSAPDGPCTQRLWCAMDTSCQEFLRKLYSKIMSLCVLCMHCAHTPPTNTKVLSSTCLALTSAQAAAEMLSPQPRDRRVKLATQDLG